MNVGPQSRPGVGLITFGALFLGLSAGRIAIGWNPGPGWVWFECVNIAVGLALCYWGGSRLQRAKAEQPDLSWRQFLRTDLSALGLVLVLFAVLGAFPEESEALLKWMREFANLLGIARGRP